MKLRSKSGQSMVEYSIGIGCVLAVCLLVLGGLGFGAEDVIRQVLLNINDQKDQSVEPSPGSNGGIFSNGISGASNPPWKPK
jgi:hypothetical protein